MKRSWETVCDVRAEQAHIIESEIMSPSVSTRENREFASEVKFVVTPGIAEGIRDWVRGRLAADPHAGGPTGDNYRITSLYFDTPQFDVFQRNKSYGRCKYRVRRYGNNQVVYLERKLKTKGLVTKRRALVPIGEVGFLRTGLAPQGWCGNWFARRMQLRRMTAVCQVSYSRTARVGMTANGPVRLTLDEDLRANLVEAPTFKGEPGLLLSRGFVIIEMKFLFALPALFKNIIEEFRLEARPFSKYRLAAHKLGLGEALDYEELEGPRSEEGEVCPTF